MDRQSQQKEGYQELLTDEGRELDEALREAQQALAVARQFVNSPSLCEHALATEERLPLRQMPSEAEVPSRERSVAEAPSKPPGRKKSRPGARPAQASAFASQGAAAGLTGDCLPGEAAARARVRRAKSCQPSPSRSGGSRQGGRKGKSGLGHGGSAPTRCPAGVLRAAGAAGGAAPGGGAAASPRTSVPGAAGSWPSVCEEREPACRK